MAHLPGEILETVFHNLRNHDLIPCSQVNRLWFGEATRELWSREIEITSPRVLDAMLNSRRRETNVGYIQNTVFNACKDDAYFEDAEKTLQDDGDRNGISAYGKLLKVLNEIRLLSCRQVTLRTIWEEVAQGDMFHNWRKMEKLALSTVGPRTEELVLEEIDLPRYVEPVPRPNGHLVSLNGIERLRKGTP